MAKLGLYIQILQIYCKIGYNTPISCFLMRIGQCCVIIDRYRFSLHIVYHIYSLFDIL